MLHLLGLSGLALAYLAFPAHGAQFKSFSRGVFQCTPNLADAYCKSHIESSSNPSGTCEGGSIVCDLTSPSCTNAAGCEGACSDLADKNMFVQPQCFFNKCRCEVSEGCTINWCARRCANEYRRKRRFRHEYASCLPNNICMCEFSDQCTSDADCRSVCEKQSEKELTHCSNNQICLCKYEDECTYAWCEDSCRLNNTGMVFEYSDCLPDNRCSCTYSATLSECTSNADCRSVCEKHPGKISTWTVCISGRKCLCQYQEECTQARCEAWCTTQNKGKFVQSPECLSNNRCNCRFSKPCTSDAQCRSFCEEEHPEKQITSTQCGSDRKCLCKYEDPCTSDAQCRSFCEEKYPEKQITSTQCGSDRKCLCKYEDPCTGEADCRMACAKAHPGKKLLSTKCGKDRQCFCEYLDGGTGTAIRPSVLTIAIILLTTLAMIPAPAEGKLGALLIPSAIFGFSTSQLAFG